jgi:hypothetical protein
MITTIYKPEHHSNGMRVRKERKKMLLGHSKQGICCAVTEEDYREERAYNQHHHEQGPHRVLRDWGEMEEGGGGGGGLGAWRWRSGKMAGHVSGKFCV